MTRGIVYYVLIMQRGPHSKKHIMVSYLCPEPSEPWLPFMQTTFGSTVWCRRHWPSVVFHHVSCSYPQDVA